MTKRLQVLLEHDELRELRRIARSRGLTMAEWVRQTLRAARRHEPLGDAARKLDGIRRAATHAFPSGDIEAMLGEIERGYGDVWK